LNPGLTNQYAAQRDAKDENVSTDGIIVGSVSFGKEFDFGVEPVLGESLEIP
jgi:hypothetical protein